MMLTRFRARCRAAPILTALIVLAGFVAILGFPLLAYGPIDVTQGTGNIDFATFIRGIPFQIILTVLILGAIWALGWWDISLLLRPIAPHVNKALIAIIAFPLAGIIIFTILLFDTDQARRPFEVLALILCLNFFVSLSEEALFRGVVFGAFREKMSLLVAIMLSSLAFGSLHFLNAGIGQGIAETTFQVINAAALGVLFCALVLQGASLWPAILLHMIWNSYAMLGLAAVEFAGESTTAVPADIGITSFSFILPAVTLTIASAVLYQYRARTGLRFRDRVPVGMD